MDQDEPVRLPSHEERHLVPIAGFGARIRLRAQPAGRTIAQLRSSG